MTKNEALKEMEKGNKITHRWFSPNEWVTIENNLILFEDGVKCTQKEFWQDRNDETWNDGYSIWKEN